jgi:uncharacterized lipoprotein YbaY
MNRISPKLLLVLLLCALVVTATTASVLATRLTAAAPQSSDEATIPAPAIVKGTVMYRELVALKADAVITVQLVDFTLGAPTVVLGEQIIHPAGRPVPFEFEIRCDAASIKPNGIYRVDANITVDGKPLFQTATTRVMVTRDYPTVVEVVLTTVGPWSPFDLALSSGRLARFSY